jgi:hypothetical protein
MLKSALGNLRNNFSVINFASQAPKMNKPSIDASKSHSYRPLISPRFFVQHPLNSWLFLVEYSGSRICCFGRITYTLTSTLDSGRNTAGFFRMHKNVRILTDSPLELHSFNTGNLLGMLDTTV